jgi:amidohydrolase
LYRNPERPNMPALNAIADFADDLTTWRRYLHQHPELGFDCHKTAAFVVERLREMGITEIHEGIAQSGVVAIIEGQGDGPTIGLRADMDALPMSEETGADYASTVNGKMHACGHDGHTTMLLGAARYLADTRNFKGRVALIFQPAEEGGGGGNVMVHEGIMDRFEIAQVYALHNAPDIEVGRIETRPGPMMAGVSEFKITVKGVGGHAAWPHGCVDPVAAAMQIGTAINTIVSRNVGAVDQLVISLTMIEAGTATNIIPETAVMQGTVRNFRSELLDLAEKRISEICAGTGTAMGVEVTLDFTREYPPTINDAEKTAFAVDVARELVGADMVSDDTTMVMGAEDFSYMLNVRPGCYLNVGQGVGPFCHHPKFDFNDEIAPIGASFLARLVERAQPLG